MTFAQLINFPINAFVRSVWQDQPQTGDQAGGGPAAGGAGHAVPDAERVPADGHVPRPDRAGVRLGRAVPRPLSGEIMLGNSTTLSGLKCSLQPTISVCFSVFD